MNILFVCVGNSCRSQMAEALANHLGQGQVRAWSAGSHPLGSIVPETYEVLREKGLALEGHSSKGLGDVPVNEMDMVVGMGCEVICPVPAGFKGRLIEWNIPDPYEQDLEFFRQVRDLIERQVTALVEELKPDAAGVARAEQDLPLRSIEGDATCDDDGTHVQGARRRGSPGPPAREPPGQK